MADSLETLTNKVAGLETAIQTIENALKQASQLNEATVFDGTEKTLIHQGGELKQSSTVPSSISTSTTIHLNKTESTSHRATGINPLTGALTIDLTGVVENGWATAFITTADGSWPTVTVINGTGKGVAGSNITAITKTIGSLPSAGDFNVHFTYINGQLLMFSEDASGAVSGGIGDTTAPTWVTASFEVGTIADNIIVMPLDEAVVGTSTPAVGDFEILVDAVANVVTNVDITTNTQQVRLTLTTAVTNGQTVTTAYTKGTNPLKDLSNNEVSSITSTAVTNNVAASGSYGLEFALASSQYAYTPKPSTATWFTILTFGDTIAFTNLDVLIGNGVSPSTIAGGIQLQCTGATTFKLRVNDGSLQESGNITVAADDIIRLRQATNDIIVEKWNGSSWVNQTTITTSGFTLGGTNFYYATYNGALSHADLKLAGLDQNGVVFLPTTQSSGSTIDVGGNILTLVNSPTYFAV